MARDFYPFVEKDPDQAPSGAASLEQAACSARIAVYDDTAAAPRVVVVDPQETRSYLEEITQTVTKLSHDQGGSIPFMVIREVVENLIHAYFQDPAISILDGGNTIRFADQGPGIREKARALEYGTTSATEEMKHYIRGVGSGLPYAQEYLEKKGGYLRIEDNIIAGTIVTIALPEADAQGATPHTVAGVPLAGTEQGLGQQLPAATPQMPAWQQYQPQQQQPYQQYPQQQAWQQPSQQGWPAQGYPQQPYAQPYPPQAYGQPYPQQGMPQGAWPPAYQQQPYPQQMGQQISPMPAMQPQQQPHPSAAASETTATGTQTTEPATATPSLSERGRLIVAYLKQHESVGPTELVREHGLSQPTWSRELRELEALGVVEKQGGQKRFLTALGRELVL